MRGTKNFCETTTTMTTEPQRQQFCECAAPFTTMIEKKRKKQKLRSNSQCKTRRGSNFYWIFAVALLILQKDTVNASIFSSWKQALQPSSPPSSQQQQESQEVNSESNGSNESLNSSSSSSRQDGEIFLSASELPTNNAVTNTGHKDDIVEQVLEDLFNTIPPPEEEEEEKDIETGNYSKERGDDDDDVVAGRLFTQPQFPLGSSSRRDALSKLSQRQRRNRSSSSLPRRTSVEDLPSTQPLQTLEKLRQMLDETDYMMMTKHQGGPQHTPQQQQQQMTRRNNAGNESLSQQQQQQSKTDKLWTSKDRSKYKRQRRRAATTAAATTASQERSSKQLPQRQRLTMPIHPHHSPSDNDDDETDDDTDDDGLGYVLPNLPVYMSDQEDDEENDRREDADESEVDSGELPSQQQQQQQQPLPSHWPHHNRQHHNHYPGAANQQQPQQQQSFSASNSQPHDPRSSAVGTPLPMVPNEPFEPGFSQYPPPSLYYQSPYWLAPGYQQIPPAQQQPGGGSAGQQPTSPYFPPYMGYHHPPLVPPIMPNLGSYPYPYPPCGAVYGQGPTQQQQQQGQGPQRPPGVYYSPQQQQQQQSSYPAWTAQWGARRSFLPNYQQQQQISHRMALRKPDAAKRVHPSAGVGMVTPPHYPSEQDVRANPSGDHGAGDGSVESIDSASGTSTQMVVYPVESLLSASWSTSAADASPKRLTLDSVQKLSFLVVAVTLMCYSAVSPRHLPLAHYHRLAFQNFRLVGLSLLAPLFNGWLVWDKASLANNNINHFVTTFYMAFTVGYLLVFGLELLVTTLIRLGVFWWFERQVFQLHQVPMPILPWVLREHRYRPKRISLFLADFVTSCIACPIIEEYIKLKILQWTVQLPRNFNWTTKVSNKNKKKRRVAEVIPRSGVYEREVINVNSYVTQMLAASLGLKFCDVGRRILMYTKARDVNKDFYALMRGIFPIHELCGIMTALALARRDVLGVDMPIWKMLFPSVFLHGMANFRGKKPIFKWNSATPWSEMQLFPWNSNEASVGVSPLRQLFTRKAFPKLMWLIILTRVLGYCVKNYFLVNRQAVKRTTTFAGNHAAFSAELAAAEVLKKTSNEN